MSKTTVLLVDDSPLFLEHLRAWLSRREDVDVVGWAHSGAEAIALAEKLQPEVVLLDVAMPEMNGFQATRQLKLLANAPAVLILTLEPSYRAAAVAAGAEGFVCKTEFETELPSWLNRIRRQK